MELIEKNNLEESNLKENNLENNINIEKKQNNFLESSLGKIVNTAVDVGIRYLLPDLVENQVIDIKNTLIENGLKEGIDKTIKSAIDFGKSAIGIFTGNFENISQVQLAVEKGGMIDTVSKLIDNVLNKCTTSGKITKATSSMIKQGKNVILDNISSNIENMLTEQINSVEKLGTYSQNWNNYYLNKDFEGMEKEYKKIKTQLNKIIPLETTIKQAREIENIHNLIKNNGHNFNLTENEVQVAKKLVTSE